VPDPRLPSDVADPDTYWLRTRAVSDSELVGDEAYFDRHGVTRPAEVDVEALPPADGEAVRELDRAAVDREKLIGKWQVFGDADRVDELWPGVVADAANGRLWAAKATTPAGREKLPYDSAVLAVYTPNYLDLADVRRVRERLREAHGVDGEIYYKPDLYTAEGMGPDNYGEWGLEKPARYEF
jgi:hypothetical protein